MNPTGPKIVVVGKNGQVARDLLPMLAPLGHVTAIGRPELDLAEPDTIRDVMQRLQPDVIINAAAYTAVDRAESEPEIAMKVNTEGPRVLAEEAKRLEALFITYSSDYVFDGAKPSPYEESDPPNPINVYGASKLAGDRAVEAVGGAYLIFRTSWVYSSTGANFLKTILRLAAERDELRIVDDQIGAPTWSREIARATTQVISKIVRQASPRRENHLAEKLGNRRGVYNMTAGESVSWCGFATAILAEARKYRTGAALPRVVAIPTNQYPLPAKRPMNSRLSNKKLMDVFNIALPSWRACVGTVVEELERHRSNCSVTVPF